MADDPPTRRLTAAARAGKVLLGMVHLRPLPGSPQYAGESVAAIAAAARADVEALMAAGFHGYVIENFGDAPFFKERVPPQVLTLMTRIALDLPREKALVGANVLRNDARGALAIAVACDLDFIRINVHTGAAITDQGVIEGDAAETLRQRQSIGPRVAILADVDVKHALPLGSGHEIAAEARDAAYRGLADGLIATGHATGAGVAMEDLQAVREAVPDRPLFAGSGVTAATVRDILRLADGVIVGSSLKPGGRAAAPVDLERAREFARRAGCA